jgi:hypothetical protein
VGIKIVIFNELIQKFLYCCIRFDKEHFLPGETDSYRYFGGMIGAKELKEAWGAYSLLIKILIE